MSCFLDTKINFRICFVKLKLLLVAIEVKDKEDNDAKISINPRQATTPGYTIGYFWAQSAEEVKRYLILIFDLIISTKCNDAICRANFYCNGCHEDITDENLIRRCMCKNCKLILSFWS